MFYVYEYHHPLAPPLLEASYPDALRVHTREIREIHEVREIQGLCKASTTDGGGVVVWIYDMIEEPSRKCAGDTLSPRPRHDALQYLVDLRDAVMKTKGVEVKWCLFHAIRPEDTLGSLETWYARHYPLFDALVMIGNHWNPLKVDTVIPHFLSLALPHPLFGSVVIPHRPGETQRCLDRQRRGVRFFVSQLQLYPTPEWRYFVHLLGHRMITLTTVPMSERQLHFLETLGVRTDAYQGLHDTLENNVARCLQWLEGVSYAFEILGEKHRSQYLDALLPRQ